MHDNATTKAMMPSIKYSWMTVPQLSEEGSMSSMGAPPGALGGTTFYAIVAIYPDTRPRH
jgi:hypothetical protein